MKLKELGPSGASLSPPLDPPLIILVVDAAARFTVEKYLTLVADPGFPKRKTPAIRRGCRPIGPIKRVGQRFPART